MRLSEGLSLRIKDVDFDREEIIIHDGKGFRDRITILPATLQADLRVQRAIAQAIWKRDRTNQRPGVELPHAPANKFPRAGELLNRNRYAVSSPLDRLTNSLSTIGSPDTDCGRLGAITPAAATTSPITKIDGATNP
jgi:integrase